MMTFFAVGDTAAHEGWIRTMHGPAWPAEGGWTYQDATGPHGRILYEGPDEDVARSVLAEWERCDAPKTGRYCYAHNRCGR